MKKILLLCLLPLLLFAALFFTACDTEADPCAEGHTAQTDAALAPSCTEKGLTEGSHCAVCQTVIVAQEQIPATGHVPGEWTVTQAPTCTAQGTRTRSCTVCEMLLFVESTAPLGHSFGEWENTALPTCTKEGAEQRTCTTCKVSESRSVATVSHTPRAWVTDLAPTCLQGGSRHRSCAICENIIDVETLKATGHSFGTYTQTLAPTCLQSGTETAICAICEAVDTRTLEATGHVKSADWVIDIAASCNTPGSQHKSCTKCDAVLETTTIAPAAHLWMSWTVTTPATCTATGEQTRTCSRCLQQQTEELERAAHTPSEWTVTLQPTCTTKGMRHKSCLGCGILTAMEEISALSHTPGEYVRTKEPTCTQAGEEATNCTTCNEQLIRTLDALSHNEGEWVTDLLPTCGTAGQKHLSCTRCAMVLKTERIPEKEHEWGVAVTVQEATCTSIGLKTKTCAACQKTQNETTEALSHTPSEWIVDQQPTCQKTGKRHKICTGCEAVLSFETIPTTAHQYGDWTVTTPASCFAQGVEARLCATCQQGEQRLLDPIAHTPGEPIVDLAPSCDSPGSQHVECTACHTVLETGTLPKKNHSWSSVWKQISAPTCTQTGLESKSCLNCSAQQTREIARIAHVPSAWTTQITPTCLGAGSKYQKCKTCDSILDIQPIEATGHSFDAWSTALPSTCSVQGVQTRTCTACNREERELLPTAAHTPGLWETTLSPTCITEGAKQRSCKICNAIVAIEAIAKSAHQASDTWTVLTQPTAAQNGESARRCVYCQAPVEKAATAKNGDVAVLTQNISIPLVGYSIVYPNGKNSDTTFFSHVTALSDAVKSATGLTLSPKSDATTATKEILIGLTARAESIAAHNALDGRGFTVRVVGNKIVIVGSDDALTLSAVQYFIRNCLNATGTTLTLAADATACDLPALPLAGAAGSDFVFVMDADLDNDPLHMYVSDSYNNQGYSGDGRDYPVYLFEKLLSNVAIRTGVGTANLTWTTDTDTASASGYELLFGQVDRAECRAFRDELDGNEYGFYITGKKVIVTAHTDAGLELALTAFLRFYDYVISCNGGILPQGYREVGSVTTEEWRMDFPRPTGVTIAHAQHANNHSLQMVYTGTGATAAGFLAYCKTLEDAGYVLVMKNDNPGNTGSYFRSYKNEAKNHALYVAYNAFSYEEVYKNSARAEDHIQGSSPNGTFVPYPMRDYEQCIRVITAPLSSAYLPTDEILQDTYDRTTDKICESSITTVRLVGSSVGMSYILQLEDGRFVIIDGGNNVAANMDKEILYATLKELHKKSHGSYPTKEDPIHIAAWLITHSHGDHYGNTNAFLKAYVPEGLIKMDYLIGNFPEMSTIYPVGSDTVWMGQNVSTLRGYFTSANLTPFTFVKVYTGMTLYFANLKMEILMTYGDHAPYRINNSNDTNTVTKWTIRSDNKDTTWMVLGDSCVYQSRWLCAMWGGSSYNTSTKLYDGGYLQADMVQLAHHGNIGCEIALYKTIRPAIVWFPHNSGAYDNYVNGSNTTSWPYNVDRFVCRELSTVKFIIVSGNNNANSTDTVTMSFTASGPSTSGSKPFWGIKYNKSTGEVSTETFGCNTKNVQATYTFTILGYTYKEYYTVIKK
ncbi:MAG: MBL fold metallo-hydrolase [Ruminococcaceae bacterium]|nr:MBL fold metallo-hydrolase [Oscillospiraceae bacterium]